MTAYHPADMDTNDAASPPVPAVAQNVAPTPGSPSRPGVVRSDVAEGDLAASFAAGYAQLVGAALVHLSRSRGVELGSDVAVQARADMSADRISVRLTVHVSEPRAREAVLAALSMLPSTTDRGDLVLSEVVVSLTGRQA